MQQGVRGIRAGRNSGKDRRVRAQQRSGHLLCEKLCPWGLF